MTVTELLDHRLVGIGRHLWRSPSPTLLLKWVHLGQAAQDCIKDSLYLQRETPLLLCRLFPGLFVNLKVLPHVLLELHAHHFLPVAFTLLLGTTGKCLAPSS